MAASRRWHRVRRSRARRAGSRRSAGNPRLGQALRDGRELDGPLVTELAHDGDPAACAVLELIGERLGVALANFVNIFNPEMIVVGGGVMGGWRDAARAGPRGDAPPRAAALA